MASAYDGKSLLPDRKTPVRHLADMKGKKYRVLASQFQTVPFGQLGANPVALTLGDVLPALQQGTIDGAVSALKNFVSMHFGDTTKYVTEIGQPSIFTVMEVNKKWYEFIAARSATGHRPGRRHGVARGQSAGDRYPQWRTQGLGGQWRRIDQLAVRRADLDAQNSCGRR